MAYSSEALKSFSNDCIDWFLERHPHTSNALVNGDYLVHLTTRAAPNEGVVNNMNSSTPTDRSTTLADLLTNTSIKIYGIEVAPIKRDLGGQTSYELTFIHEQFIRELVVYFRERGVAFSQDSDRLSVLKLNERHSSRNGFYSIQAEWKLPSILTEADRRLENAVEKMVASYDSVFGNLARTPSRPEGIIGPSPQIPEVLRP